MDKITDNLFVGDIRAAQNAEILQRHCITHIVTIGKDLSPMFPQLYNYFCLPLVEETTECIGKHFNSFCKFVKSAIRRDSANVLIHCMTGNNLSVCFAAAYLIKAFDYTLGTSLKIIKRARPNLKPYSVFLSQLQSY